MKVMRLSPFLQFSCLIINFMTSKMSTVPYMHDWTMQSIRTPDMSKLVIFVWNTFLQCLECFSWGSGSFFQRSLSLPVNVIIQIAQHYLNIKYLGTLQDINIFSCKNKTLHFPVRGFCDRNRSPPVGVFSFPIFPQLPPDNYPVIDVRAKSKFVIVTCFYYKAYHFQVLLTIGQGNYHLL